jgi:hypothetical protein
MLGGVFTHPAVKYQKVRLPLINSGNSINFQLKNKNISLSDTDEITLAAPFEKAAFENQTTTVYQTLYNLASKITLNLRSDQIVSLFKEVVVAK